MESSKVLLLLVFQCRHIPWSPWCSLSFALQYVKPALNISNVKCIVFNVSPCSPLSRLLGCVTWIFNLVRRLRLPLLVHVIKLIALLEIPSFFVEAKIWASSSYINTFTMSSSKVLHCASLRNYAIVLVFIAQIFKSSIMSEVSFICHDKFLNLFMYAVNSSPGSLWHCLST